MRRKIQTLTITLFLFGATIISFSAETKIGGQYRIMANTSNFGWHQLTFGNSEKSNSLLNQRFRMNFDSKFDKRTRAHIQIQFNTGPGGIRWGDGTAPKSGKFALRHAYLDFKAAGFTIKAGIQDWSDGFGEVLASGDWDFNTGGILAARNLGVFDLKFGTLKIHEGNSRISDDSDLYVVDADFCWAAFHAYYLHDKSVASQTETDLWVGFTAKKKIASAVLNSFFIYNSGATDIASTENLKHTGYAAKIEGKIELGVSSVAVQAIYSTGQKSNDKNSNEFKTLQADGQGYWSYLSLFTPRGSSDVNNLRASLRNRDQQGIARGLTTIQANYSFPILKNKLTGYLAAGLFKAAEKDANGNSDMGSELMAEGKYNITESLAIEFGVSYAKLGDFYREPGANNSPADLYEFFSRLQVEF